MHFLFRCESASNLCVIQCPLSAIARVGKGASEATVL
jgi:hypothetical protein